MKSVYYFNITFRCNNNCIFCAADHGYNTTNQQMPFSEFKNQLENKVKPGDRVIINGGEPTTHNEFFDFLNFCHKNNLYIDLYSNGNKFKDIFFCKNVLKFAPILIRIPLFGHVAEDHDRLTGFHGNFSMVMSGIKNIIMLQNKYVDLEIKLLMSKPTYINNINIFKTVVKQFPQRGYSFSINPLLVSNKVREHHDLVFLPYSYMIEKSLELYDVISSESWPISLDLIPFCLMPIKYFSHQVTASKHEIIEYYSDPYNNFKFFKKNSSQKCDICILQSICPQFPNSYIDYFGDSEVSPFLEKDFNFLVS